MQYMGSSSNISNGDCVFISRNGRQMLCFAYISNKMCVVIVTNGMNGDNNSFANPTPSCMQHKTKACNSHTYE